MAPPPAKKRRVSASAVVMRRTTRSQKPRLSAELLGKVASYSSLGDDLLNLCIVAGPKNCAAIRHAYLRNNLSYLQYALGYYIQKKCSDWKLCGDRYLAWMEINADWRRHVTDERIESMAKVANQDDAIALMPFNNPAVAIELGLMDALKYLVEEMEIDINAYRWTNYFSSDPRTPNGLLMHCIVCENYELFQYLLCKEHIDVNCSIYEGTDTTVIKQCLSIPCLNTRFFRDLLYHPSFSLTSNFQFNGADKPLHFALFVLNDNGKEPWFDFSSWKQNVQELLSFGVDPSVGVGAFGTAIDFARYLANTSGQGSPRQKALEEAGKLLGDWALKH